MQKVGVKCEVRTDAAGSGSGAHVVWSIKLSMNLREVSHCLPYLGLLLAESSYKCSHTSESILDTMPSGAYSR